MSLAPSSDSRIPQETSRIARAAFPSPSRFMQMRDHIGTIYDDAAFAELYPRRGQPAEAPWRLALVTLMQFADSLSDRQAADAVRGRIDWKYALALEFSDAGFHYSVLSKFRKRLVEAQAESLLLNTLLDQPQSHGWLKAGGQARTDSTHVLAAIRTLNRLENVGETLRAALNDLAPSASARQCLRGRRHVCVQRGSRVHVERRGVKTTPIAVPNATSPPLGAPKR